MVLKMGAKVDEHMVLHNVVGNIWAQAHINLLDVLKVYTGLEGTGDRKISRIA